MVMNISCKFEKFTYNTLASRGLTRISLHTAAAVAYSCKPVGLITRPTHCRTDANLYPPERQLTKASVLSFDLEGEAKGQI